MATDDDNGNYGAPTFHAFEEITLKSTPETLLILQLSHEGTLLMYTCRGCLDTAENVSEQLHRLADELLDRHKVWVQNGLHTATEEPT